MAFAVFLTEGAEGDLTEIFDYIARHDAPGKAELVLDQIGGGFISLGEQPERGTFPRELLALGIREFREVFFKPYRILYRLTGKNVFVMMIADGRRDMQTLLQRRLLES